MKKLILFLMLSFVFGCSYSRTTDPNANQNTDTPQAGLTNPSSGEAAVRFNDVKTTVFDSSCTTCHESRGLSLDFSTYANVKKYLTKINNDVFVNGSMPPQGSLSTLQKQVLRTWIDSGSPE